MRIIVKNEAPFQILTSAMSIGPSPTGYQLEVSADGKNFSPLFSVAANTTKMATGLAPSSYYRLKNNVGDVVVNWSTSCVIDGGGGGDMSNYYTKAETDAAITAATEDLANEEYVDEQVSGLTEYIEDVERVTATALTELHTDVLALSAATPDMSDYYTKSEVDAEITGATEGFASEAYVDAAITSATEDFVTEEDLTGYTSMQDFEDFQDAISVKEEVIASAITELHTDVLALSAATPDMSDYYTSAQTEDAISAATAGKADAANVTPNDFMRFPKWNEQGVITGTTGNNLSTTGFYLNGTRRNLIKEATSGDLGDAYAPITPGTAGQILVSSGNGAPVWATDNKVDSQDVKHIVKLTQAQYDLIANPDPETLYIIINNQ